MVGKRFGLASDARSTAMIAQVRNLKLGGFVHTFGDGHLGLDHLEKALTLHAQGIRPLPRLCLNPKMVSIFDVMDENIPTGDEPPHPAICAPVTV